MIHAKLLIRRLAYVPWLLAFGLVLGWAGEAQAANEIKLTVDTTEFREDASKVPIKVIAKTYKDGKHAPLGEARVVRLSVESPYQYGDDSAAEGFATRYTMTLPSISIASGAKEASVVAELVPIPTNHENDETVTTGDNKFVPDASRIPNEDLNIYLSGDAGTGEVDKDGAGDDIAARIPNSIKITMLDSHKPTTTITLSLDPTSLSKEGLGKSVGVTASLNGAKLSDNLSFSLTPVAPHPTRSDSLAQRDRDYDFTPGKALSIRKTDTSGKTTVTITPKNDKVGYFGVGTKQDVQVNGADANADGDTRDSWKSQDSDRNQTQDFTFNEAGLGNIDGNNTVNDITIGVIEKPGSSPTSYVFSEKDRNGDGTTGDFFDFNGDGDTDDVALTEIKEEDFLYTLDIIPANFLIAGTSPVEVGTGLTPSVASVRESLPGQTASRRTIPIELDLKLKTGPAEATTLGLLIRDEGDAPATRGTDYEATVTSIPLAAGQTTGKATLTLTIIDNDDTDGDRTFTVKGSIGSAEVKTTITIVDDETPTTEITLKVEPDSVKALSGEQMVTVTAHLNGETWEKDDVNITLVIDPNADKSAERDTEFEATLPMDPLTIKAGETMGTAKVKITALKEGKKVTLKSQKSPLDAPPNADGDKVAVIPVAIRLVKPAKEDSVAAAGPTALAFDSDPGDLETNVGKKVSKELPGAKEGSGKGSKEYTASPLPDGLTFNAATRMLEGTPTKEDTVTVLYTVVDSVLTSVSKKFKIIVGKEEKPTVAVSGVVVNPPSLREGDKDVSILVTATLEKEAPEGEMILFEIIEEEGDAVRDADFSASLTSSVDAGGKKQVSTVITITSHEDDDTEDENITVRVKASGGEDTASIKIEDKDAASSGILLSVDTEEIKENAGVTNVTVTASLNGKEADSETKVNVLYDQSSVAIRDSDFTMTGIAITIPKGGISAEGTLEITPIHDNDSEDDESIVLMGKAAADTNLTDGEAFIILKDVGLAFAADASIADIMGTVGTELSAGPLPEAKGAADIKYSVSALPDTNVKFDPATRMISGTPAMADTTEVTYTATAGDSTATLKFSISVVSGTAPLAFAEDASIDDIMGTVGTELSQELPAAMGGESRSYTVSDLPAGLAFNDSTRTISGTPTAADSTEVTYVATADAETDTLTFSIIVNYPPLAFAADASIADIEVTVNTALDAVTLPEATGGEGDISYAVSGLPAGVSFDDSTRTVSGTPTEEGTAEVSYTATAGDETVTLTFSITVNPELVLDLSNLFGSANGAAGKANPASEHGESLQTAFTATVGDEVSITLSMLEGVAATIEGLPDGLSYDSDTATISGTPTVAGEVIFKVTAGDQSLEWKAMIEAAGDDSAGGDEVVDGGDATFEKKGIIGQPYSLELPLPAGIAFSVSGLPAGLMFEGNTISGTPTEVTEPEGTEITISAPGVVDAQARLVVRNLDKPASLMAADYRGADGQGDQGGFILLSWPLSEDHEIIDGYRIYREMVAGDLAGVNIPWAMVDAVPGAETGYAIVATLDNVSTHWGIAAEQGRLTSEVVSSGAKAVFVDAENLNQPYELMAETLLASKKAARAGNAPVFATLLPEALAYAQGIAPSLKSVEGLSSAITMTAERVAALDNIPPVAVPSLSVLDAPNDEGSRIALEWTLSPSDRLLQDVVAGAISPATVVEPVVGVKGYGVYRRALGEDEFGLVGEVEAGAMAFVDETALNGVRYTYQVRPFDADNKIPSGVLVEETAIAVRNNVPGLFGADNSVGFDDFFVFADHFNLTEDDPGYDPAFDLDLNGVINQQDYDLFVEHFGSKTEAAGKRVPMFAGLNADARLYLDARTALPSVGEEFVLDVSLADFIAVKGYGLQVQYDASKLEFVETRTEQPLGGSDLAAPQVLRDETGVLTVAAYGDEVSEGEVALSLVFRPMVEIEDTVIEITDSQTYDSAFGFNRLALPAPVQLQTRPEVFALANNYPNPFNPATTIKYALPMAADVELTVYNVVGQVVRTLVAEHQSAGRYAVEWDATNDSGHSLSSGMYFYHLQAGEELEVKKMLLLK